MVEAATVKASENLIFDLIDEIATEEAEKRVIEKIPEIVEVLKSVD